MQICFYHFCQKPTLLLTYESVYFDKGTLCFNNERMVDCPVQKLSSYLDNFYMHHSSNLIPIVIACLTAYLPRTHNTFTVSKFSDNINNKNWYLHGVDCNGQLHQFLHQIVYVSY